MKIRQSFVRLGIPLLLTVGLGILLLLTGCPAAPSPLPKPPELSVTDVYTHEPSTFQFKGYVGSFIRNGVKFNDPEAQSVTVGYYLLQTTTITITVFPVPKEPPGNTLESQLTLCEEELKKELPDAKRTVEESVNIPVSKKKRPGQHAAFMYKGMHLKHQTLMHTDIYLFQEGNWFVKYRATFPEAERETGEIGFSAFIDYYRWPEEAKKAEEARMGIRIVAPKKKPEEQGKKGEAEPKKKPEEEGKKPEEDAKPAKK